jgi:SAM-dependent methyltransferase
MCSTKKHFCPIKNLRFFGGMSFLYFYCRQYSIVYGTFTNRFLPVRFYGPILQMLHVCFLAVVFVTLTYKHVSALNQLDNKDHPMFIPPSNHGINSGSRLLYFSQGVENVQLLSSFGLVNSPNTVLLDMGSGNARLFAGLLIQYETFKGQYHGMEIQKRLVDWCDSTYGKSYSNARFEHIDVSSTRYRPKGDGGDPTAFRIPAQDNTYTNIALFSVFSHMHAKDILAYLCEFKRVLKPGGVVVATIFTYNSAREPRAISSQYGAFVYDNHTRVKSLRDPLFAIVFEENWLKRNVLEPSGLELVELLYGSAIGVPPIQKRYTGLFQDAVVMRKRS